MKSTQFKRLQVVIGKCLFVRQGMETCNTFMESLSSLFIKLIYFLKQGLKVTEQSSTAGLTMSNTAYLKKIESLQRKPRNKMPIC